MPVVRLAWSTIAALALASAAVASAAETPEPYRPQHSDVSYYVPMRDGVRIAMSLWFPGNKPPTHPSPTLLIQTRYGRAAVFGKTGGDSYRQYVDAGYVVAIVDTRGSTSSFGPRDVDIGPDEMRDMDELIAHLASRPWSNGAVYVTGLSYMADTADVATSRPAPALKGGVIRETDFDAWAHLFLPGGVKNDWFLNTWGDATYRMDVGVSEDPSEGLDCRARAADCPKLWPTLQAVDSDGDFTLLREALAGRKRWTPDTYSTTEFRDDVAKNGYPLFASSPSSHLAEIRQRALPVQYWGGWMDGGTAEAALARYRSLPDVPMDVWITANDHPNRIGADPFFPKDRQPRPAIEVQVATIKAFLDRLSRGEPIERKIHYYVLGTGRFDESPVWPPADTTERSWSLAQDGRLASTVPATAGEVHYTVDFSASSGRKTRWSTQFGIPPDYRDRRDEDRKVLTFETEPFAAAVEVVGTPVLTLQMATRTTDPAVHAYLEDVAPDGTVTYLTEGELRLIQRKIADPATLPYDQGPAPHSFRRADALPVVAGEFSTVEFALFPVAARLAAGHRLRLAVAGADADTFHRYSLGQSEEFTIRVGGTQPSGLKVPMRAARAN
jgi:putative CocE/NonD family hydrolase